jgi:hypothetical protein
MKLSTKVRLTSAALLGVLGGVAQHFYEIRELSVGHDAFMAAQEARYDRVVALHHPFLGAVIVGLIFATVVFGLYELVTFLIAKALAANGDDEHRAKGS